MPSPIAASATHPPPTIAYTPTEVDIATPSLQVPTLQITDEYTPDLSVFALVGVAPGDELTVHQTADAGSLAIGTLPFDTTGIQITGNPVEAGGFIWSPIHWGNMDGWVEQIHLARIVGSLEPAALDIARRVVWSLKQRDFELLSSYIDPQKGVRFSPYSFIHTSEGDLVFSIDQVAGFNTNTTVYLWGSYDGSGAPINLTAQEYFDEFVYDVDFAQPEQIGLNQVLGQGNTINNVTEAYPQAVFVEFYFSGFEAQYEGMDWRSLRLVLEKSGINWFLIGIIHDEWTT